MGTFFRSADSIDIIISFSTAGSAGLYNCDDVLVAAVDGQGILNQIVGTQAEKINFFHEVVQHHYSGGHFNHHADRHVAVERNAVFL